MSYRTRLGAFPKNKHDLYKDKTYDEIVNQFAAGDIDDFIFGSPEEFNEIELIPGLNYKSQDKWKEFYSFDVDKTTGNEFMILDKECLKEIIDFISKEVSEKYNKLFENYDESVKDGSIASMLMAKKNDWDTTYISTLILDEDNMCSSQSGSYEYIIFNLIGIYKMFDWENDYLILSGW